MTTVSRLAELAVERTITAVDPLGTPPSTVGFYEARGMSAVARKVHRRGVFFGRETVLMEKALCGRREPKGHLRPAERSG